MAGPLQPPLIRRPTGQQQNPFAGAFGAEDPELQRMLRAMMEQQVQSGAMQPPPGPQQQPQVPHSPLRPPNMDREGAPLSSAQVLSLQKLKENEIAGMSEIQGAKTTTFGTALAKTLAAGASRHYGDKEKAEDIKVLKKGYQKEADLAREIRETEEKRVRDKDQIEKRNIESQINERAGKAPTSQKVYTRDAAGNEVVKQVDWNKETRQWEEKAVGDRFRPPSPGTVVNLGQKDAYAETRQEDAATLMGEKRKSADTAIKGRGKMDQFLKASEGSFEGAAGPFFSSVQNFFSSFGFDSDQLVDAASLTQAVQSTQAEYMRELGARGLTDKDMQILAQSLPQMGTSRAARDEVARIMKKTYDNNIFTFMSELEAESEARPEMGLTKPSWYKAQQPRYESWQATQELIRRGILDEDGQPI